MWINPEPMGDELMDNATHYVRMHGYSQISEGGSCDDVLEVLDHALDAGYTLLGKVWPVRRHLVYVPRLYHAEHHLLVPQSSSFA